MYRTCIFCSNPFGTNDSIEEFPVGDRLAFDAWRGRLWAVCTRCRRWNLAPIEERWEAVERCEKLFSESRLRVHSENIGMAKLRDGTRLIRVGKALPQEFAAWRYGDELVRRRKRIALWSGAGTVGAVAVGLGLTAAMSAAIVPSTILGMFHLSQLGLPLSSVRGMSRVVHRVPAESSETGEPIVIRAQDVRTARIVQAQRGEGPAILIPGIGFQRVEVGSTVRWVPPPPLRIEGEDAERILARSLVSANRRGASGSQVDSALRNLEAAWREAEEIAAIADALPDDPLDRLGGDGRLTARD
jgi:hypothetical protein